MLLLEKSRVTILYPERSGSRLVKLNIPQFVIAMEVSNKLKMHTIQYGAFNIYVTESYGDARSQIQYFLGGSCGSVLIGQITQISKQMPKLARYENGVCKEKKRLNYRIGILPLSLHIHMDHLDWCFSYATYKPHKPNLVETCRNLDSDWEVSNQT